jgi:hypothetical protein
LVVIGPDGGGTGTPWLPAPLEVLERLPDEAPGMASGERGGWPGV